MVTFHYTRHNPPSIIFLLINVSIKVRVITKLTSRVELGATVLFNKLNVLAYLVRNENAFVLILVSKVQ
jgi:hypothetical protein